MGTAKKQSKKYKPPLRTWDKTRIQRDAQLRKSYGFKNKKELWKVESDLRNIRKRARDFVGLKALNLGQQEEQEFIRKLFSMGLVKEHATVDDVLELTIENLMDRRLQSFVFKMGLAKSIREARQLITHRHILVNDRVIDTPSHLITTEEEKKIEYVSKSPLASEQHPVRVRMRKSE